MTIEPVADLGLYADPKKKLPKRLQQLDASYLVRATQKHLTDYISRLHKTIANLWP